MAPINFKLPRYVMFTGDNRKTLCLYFPQAGINDLCFNAYARDLWGTHEVFPVPDQENVVMLKCLYNHKFWKMTSPSWISADLQSTKPSASQLECQFKVHPVGPGRVALECLANNKYVQRLTAGGKTDALSAVASDATDISAQLEFSEPPPGIVPVLKLPTYVLFTGDNKKTLCLYTEAGGTDLCFNSSNYRSLWGLHQVFPVANKLGNDIVRLKCLYNQKFWKIMSTDWISAHQSSKPSASQIDSLFKVHYISPNKVALESLANNKFLKRLTDGGKTNALSAASTDANDEIAQLDVIEAPAALIPTPDVKLPRYSMFQGDNGKNLCVHYTEGHPYLSFNSNERNLWGVHEVIPIPNMQNVVMIKSLYAGKFWRRSPNWIWADEAGTPTASNLDCLFKVHQVSPHKVALESLANRRYLEPLCADSKTDLLNACATRLDRSSVQMVVSEALSGRRVFDVKYMMDQLEITQMESLLLFKTTAANRSKFMQDVSVSVTYEFTETKTWSNSTTFTTGLTVSVTAGIPDVASMSMEVSSEFSNTAEMGTAMEVKKSGSCTCIVKDVTPGSTVTVKVSGTKSTGRVPYQYRYQDTRVDGYVFPENTGADGIFTGAQVINVDYEATDDSTGALKELVVRDKK